MKVLIALLAFWSTSLIACPNLEGEYLHCYENTLKDKNGVSIGGRIHNLIIKQYRIDDKDVYHFSYKDGDDVIRHYESAIAGETKVVNKFDRWSRIDIKHEISARCEKDSLLINSKIWHSGKIFSKTKEVLMKKRKNIVHAIKGKTNDKRINSKMHCEF